MSRIKSKWTSPERFIHNFLKGRKIKHKMHPKLPGNPDVLLIKSNTAIFIHGCFWHKCPKCYKKPKSNVRFWTSKINGNATRDRRNIRTLRSAGLKTMIIWEHSIRNSTVKVMRRLIAHL